jgi:hypothetical protein
MLGIDSIGIDSIELVLKHCSFEWQLCIKGFEWLRRFLRFDLLGSFGIG